MRVLLESLALLALLALLDLLDLLELLELLESLKLGMPSFKKSAVFLNIVQKAFDPPPLLFEHLSYFAGGVFSCGEFFKRRFDKFDIMYLFYPQISPSMPQKSLFMQISCC